MHTMQLQTIRSTGELFGGRKLSKVVVAHSSIAGLEHWWRQAVTILLDQFVGTLRPMHARPWGAESFYSYGWIDQGQDRRCGTGLTSSRVLHWLDRFPVFGWTN